MAFPQDFQAVLDRVKLENPELGYQNRLKLASDLYKQAKEGRVTDFDNLPTAPAPIPVAPAPKPIAGMIDPDEITRRIRTIAGKAHIESVMMTSLYGLNPRLVMDGRDGANVLCHIEVMGQRIPADPGDFFKYFGV